MKWASLRGHVCRICTFPSGEAFLFAYEEDKAYDVLLLDVKMRNISGIDLARRIREEDDRAEIVFLTSYFEFAGEGYDVDALHYLLKPVSEKELSNAFFRTHRSYLVSLRHITRISRTSVTLEGEIELPLARGKYDEINRAYISYM